MRAIRLVHAGTVALLAWGAFAFGGNYPWAYVPLAAAAACVGGGGLAAGTWRLLPTRTGFALAAVAVAVALQLVRLPANTLATVSPATDRALRELHPAYAYGVDPAHALSIAPASTVVGLGLLVGFGLLMLGTAQWTTRHGPDTLVRSLVLLGALLAIVGLIQRPLYTDRIYGLWRPMMGGTPFGPFVNKNHFAGWMLLGLPLAYGYFGAAVATAMPGAPRALRARILWFGTAEASQVVRAGLAALLMAVALTLTMCRSGIAAIVVAAAIMMLAVRRQRTGPRRLVTGAFIVAIGAIAAVSAGAAALVSRFGDVPGIPGLGGRLPFWTDAVRVMGEFWPAGTGLNTYGHAMLLYQTALADFHVREAHSDYLQLAAEGGLLVGIPAVLAVLVFAADVTRRWRAEHSEAGWWMRLGAVTALVAIALQSIVDFSLQMPGNAAMFAVVCGIALHAPSDDVARGLGRR